MAGFGQQGVDYHTKHEEIMAGLMDSDPQYMSDPAANGTPWEDMVHIWDPPTRWAWGAGIMYDTGSTIPASDLANAPTVYYKTVLLPPLDLSYWPTGTLTVIPPSQTINVGDSASYTALYTPYGGQPVDVTSQSTWSSSDNTIATPDSTPGLFMGVAPGQVTVTASYTPPVGSALAGTVVLNVQAQQPPGGGNNQPSNPVNPPQSPTGSPGDATLTFNAVNQANIKTMTGQQIGGTLHRGPNIALWTDTVTATLSVPQPPQPIQIPNNGQFVKFNDWAITDVTLNDIPAQNPDYAFGNPVEPVSDLPPMAMTPQSNGPDMATAVSTGFEENWSEDGIGYTTPGPYGVKDVLTGQMMATTPESYQTVCNVHIGL